ncbi:MAG TPA: methyltransferase [Phenylobacterium sp.]|uniref:methyltransferase n=1 Tax=Phenylobacterium sp. TaxID=1871053 RepID=UPI002B49CD6B|nr:methyltransferase [Phenylobacterium sp.]HKR87658.1 methyltransferase [Phenylobacterium sp.]
MQHARRHPRKDQIRNAFSAALDYDGRAPVQRRAAARLAERIGALALPEDARILEVGCGTGFVGQALGPHLPRARWWATDISPEMVRRAQAALAKDPRFEFAVLDAEDPRPLAEAGPFDLICSSFAAQWFSDLEGVLAGLSRLLQPHGRMLITTLASGSFAEWRQAHADLGLSPGGPTYPGADALRRLTPGGLACEVDVYEDAEAFTSGREFLASLRSIGATTPRQDHVALGPAEIRRVLRRFEQLGGVITYRIATLDLRRSPPPAPAAPPAGGRASRRC